jgi:NTE family protein
MRHKSQLFKLAGTLFVLSLQGCAAQAWNSPAIEGATSTRTVEARGSQADEIFVVLAFSGGGTRSAAFAYGLLETLRETTVSIHGRPRRLLDEVDIITSVSGGSYTAAYYGLFGEKIFTDFETAFLKRDVQAELTSLLINPIALASLASPGVNRSDVAAAWLGDQIFENKTFADMKQPTGPFVIVNASDINTGMTFSFIQQQFDFLCSRIDDFPVGRAVMASSAVPGYFAPIALRNYDGDCPRRHTSWVTAALKRRDVYSRDYQVARALERYAAPSKMPVVRLVDGGMTDNLGVRGSMMSPIMHYGNVEDMSGAFDKAGLDKVSKVLVVVANAQTYEDYAWSREGRDPGLIDSLSASFDSAIGILNSETIGLARRGFMQWADRINRRPGRAGRPPVEVKFAALTFDQIRDADERRYFNSVPMALSLPAKQVDEVRALAGRLLRESREYNEFIQAFR